ncbi:MAG: hypothetical protein R3B46_14425 [Phycisphaerales bacterium]
MTTRISGSLGAALLISLAAGAPATVTVTMQLIPDALSADDLSPDGQWVVGSSGAGGFFPGQPYRWNTVTGQYTLLAAPGIDAVGVSDSGAVVVGDIPNPEGDGAEVAGRWRATTLNWQGLGYLPNAMMCPSRSNSYEVSADGTVVVGLSWDGCSGRAMRWTSATGMQELESLANGNNRASVVSSDGTVVAGFAQGSFSRTPAMWDGPTGVGMLLDPPNGDVIGEVHGMSDDGTILLCEWGANDGSNDVNAVKWTALGGPEVIGAGQLIPGWSGIPEDIADNGTIVGFDFLLGNRRAWIQPGGTGPLVLMRDFVLSNGGTIPPELASGQIWVAQAISADGTKIIGHGGGSYAWLITITGVPSACAGDANETNFVDVDDLNIVLSNWNKAVYFGTNGDVDGSGFVDVDDLNEVLSNWNQGCP